MLVVPVSIRETRPEKQRFHNKAARTPNNPVQKPLNTVHPLFRDDESV
jgi:hypothetical protein